MRQNTNQPRHACGGMQPELNPVQLKELARLSRVCEMTGREICLGGGDRLGWFFGVFNLTNHEVEPNMVHRGDLGWLAGPDDLPWGLTRAWNVSLPKHRIKPF